jgi:hypothetical protein
MLTTIKRVRLFKMESSIKSLTITGSAAEDAMKPRRSGGSRKKRQADAGAEEDTEFIENAKRLILGKQTAPCMITHVQPQVKHHVQPQVPLQAQPQAQPQGQPQVAVAAPVAGALPLEGGSVILKPPKNPRVKLQPKIAAHPTNTQTHGAHAQTRKARRIRLTVANLNHRFTRAKRVKDDTEKKSSDTIREFLIQKGVIQAKSKAPEKMLRSMYSDFMLLKDQAL